MDTSKLLYCIKKGEHSKGNLADILASHPEVKFVSLVGVDVYGHFTDEKIPVKVMFDDLDGFISKGVQTDGSSVFLPAIADCSNAKVDIMPDPDADWYVEYNFDNIDENGLPCGSLRIPSFLIHNNNNPVGSRNILKDAISYFSDSLMTLIKAHPELAESLMLDDVNDIESIYLTSATELEFYVQTPHEAADKERLMASQEMKEQYWKRTVGPVRTALEQTIELLDRYGISVEMGHKEVGGVKAEMVQGGEYSHIMEQLEIDWKYSDPMKTADVDRHVRNIVRDVFRANGLDVTFMAKPVQEVAGSGKHTHIGAGARLKNGKKVNLFTSATGSYLSSVGFGALMGILKNYEIIAPFASANNDAFNRLKPGYEAPVCIVTSLGHSVETATRNRTVLVGLVRDDANPMATHFELRSPNPKSNTYMVLSATLMAMLDGIRSAVNAGKTAEDLCESISKESGTPDFYLDTQRKYRAENNIFSDYSDAQREKLFGKAPATVWECISAFDEYPEKAALLLENMVMSARDLESYKISVVDHWASELRERLVSEWKDSIRKCRRLEGECMTALDEERWKKINDLRLELMQDTLVRKSILTSLCEAIDAKNYPLASELQIKVQAKMEMLDRMYREYEHNLI